MIDRIQSRSAFARIRRDGVHLRSGLLSCTMVLDSSLSAPQVGYALSRSFGSAVERNRLRRRLRELVKTRESQLPAGIFVFGGSPRAKVASFAELDKSLNGLLHKIEVESKSTDITSGSSGPVIHADSREVPGVSPLANPNHVESADHTATQDLILRAIRWYQTSREGRPSPCRFWPTCSHYAYEAVEVHGSVRGLWLAARRLSRCRPFGSSGVDPVPAPKARP